MKLRDHFRTNPIFCKILYRRLPVCPCDSTGQRAIILNMEPLGLTQSTLWLQRSNCSWPAICLYALIYLPFWYKFSRAVNFAKRHISRDLNIVIWLKNRFKGTKYREKVYVFTAILNRTVTKQNLQDVRSRQSTTLYCTTQVRIYYYIFSAPKTYQCLKCT